MQITYRWLTEFLGFTIPPRELIEKLVMIGHEVAGTVDLGMLENPIRIARILKVEPHPAREASDAGPNAQNLTVCTVDDGSGQPAKVVCGAPNAAEGMVTVLARAGAKLPGGLALRKTKIRGVASEGMLLAEDEMRLGGDHSGIVELESGAPVGEGYDLILEVEITPNRSDCLSVQGLARDLAAAYRKKLFAPPVRLKESYEHAEDFARVSIRRPDHCPRYMARLVRGVKVGPSPDWLRRRLLAVGLRPINNVVDATNLVLMELGHPLHAFDHDKLRKGQIVVRLAVRGETIRLIDESEIELEAGQDLVIADAERPVALAGVMGGAETAVSDETRNILLECALFNPGTIRRTARRHGLSSDSSYRFERGVDPAGIERALDRCAALLAELADGTVPRGVLDVYAKKESRPNLMLRPKRACQVLGLDLAKIEIADLVASIGCQIVRAEDGILVIAPPSHRLDIAREEDLYEEIARLYGYDKIPATMPYLPVAAHALPAPVHMRRLLQNLMTGLGFQETIHVSFIGTSQLEEMEMDTGQVLKVLNPISRDMDVLRPDLAPSMIRTLVYNQNRGNGDLHFFEVSKTFHFGDMASPCVEKQRLILAAMGARNPASWQDGTERDADYFSLKGVLETLFAKLCVGGIRYVPGGGPTFLHPGRSARLVAGGGKENERELGWIGEISPKQRERLGLKKRPVLAEVFVDTLTELVHFERMFREIPRHPAIERDLALVLDQEVPAGKVESFIRSAAGDLLESLFLFDSYAGEQVGAGKKSLGYRLVYRHADRTLTDDEVDAIQKTVLDALSREVGALLRE